VQLQTEDPTREEVENTIAKLKNNKAPGTDSITAELIEHKGQILLGRIHKLILRIWQKEKVPAKWKEGLLCPIFKKGLQLQSNNYRGITLLNVTYKMLVNIILKRLNVYAEEIIGEYQYGF
jgi:hypothetical protein